MSKTERYPVVVLLRHAQSRWNLENRFTGWADPALTEAGELEAQEAGLCLHHMGFQFDVAYSSRLKRAMQTRELVLQPFEQSKISYIDDWRLNERHYGKLQGRNKLQATEQVGEEQVWRWRRSYLELAEPLTESDPTHPKNDPLYSDIPREQLPSVENLAQTRKRVNEFWQQRVVPQIQSGKKILISAHGNTLRALIMQLSGMGIAEVEGFEIPTAMPILYTFNAQAKPLFWQYLDAPCLSRTA